MIKALIALIVLHLMRSTNQSFVIYRLHFFSLSEKMLVLQLLAITERKPNLYIFHILVTSGTRQFICQYVKDHVNSGSINLICANRNASKKLKTSACKARITLIFRYVRINFIFLTEESFV